MVNGQKMFISRVLQSDLMLLLARTTPVAEVKKKTDGLSVFLIDIRHLKGKGLEVRPLRMMMNHSTNALFFDNMEIPADSLIGQEGKGFSYILDGMNAERILVASDSLGDARWFIEKAVAYSSQRVIFGKPIGANQGVQFPIAKAHMAIEAADLMRTKAAKMFDAGHPVRARGQHGQVPGLRGGHRRRQRLHRLPRRLRLRRGVRHRAQVPRVAPLPRGADQQQPHHGLRRGARPRHAALVLGRVSLPPRRPPEVDRLSVTTVVDNFIDSLRADEKVAKRFTHAQARRMPTLKAEHGLGHWVEVARGGETRRIAFDFGLTGESYTHNFLELGLDAGQVDAIASPTATWTTTAGWAASSRPTAGG